MKRADALRWRRKIEHAASMLTDEDALESVELFPPWRTATAYAEGDRIQDEAILYRCVQAHTSQDDWRPAVTPALWVIVSVDEWPEWIQPQGAHDAYNTGDKVSHNEKHWVSAMDANIYEPGVYGWNEVSE